MRMWDYRQLRVIGLALALGVCQGCKATSSDVSTSRNPQVKILSVGLFESGQSEKIPNEASPTGYSLDVHDVVFVKGTKVVPAKLGTTFGFFFYVSGTASNETGKLVYSFPQMKDPKSGKSITRVEREEDFGPSPSLWRMLYRFAEDHELVCGKWKFQIFINDKLVGTKKFTVVPVSPLVGLPK